MSRTEKLRWSNDADAFAAAAVGSVGWAFAEPRNMREIVAAEAVLKSQLIIVSFVGSPG
jgi:hypothetical protein